MTWLKDFIGRQRARSSAKRTAVAAFRSRFPQRVLSAHVIGALDDDLVVRVVFAQGRPSGRAWFRVDPSDSSARELAWELVRDRFGERPWR